MRSIYRILVLVGLLLVALPDGAEAQVSVRRGGSTRKESTTKKKSAKPETKKEATPKPATATQAKPAAQATPTKRTQPNKAQQAQRPDGITVRQQQFDEYQQRDSDAFVPWQHVVYRELDLTQAVNAPLYYPVEPQDGLVNMFSVLLRGLCDGKIRGYEFLDGREVFTPKYQVNPRDVLDKFQIFYTVKAATARGGADTYSIEDTDIPSTEVLSYYVKERWEFDQHTSKYGPRILALCPVLHRSGDWGGEAVSYPMFWVNYEDVRALLRQHLVMSDGMNNTPRYTMEDFFALEQYRGDIYKVQNVRGLSLMQQYPNADTLKVVRAHIEAELRGFKDSIWVHEPTAAELAVQDSIAAAQRASRRAERATKSRSVERADSSARRNRRTKAEVDVAAAADAEEAKVEAVEQRIEQTGKAHSARRRR